MDVRFNANTANQLIKQMENYCDNIYQDAKSLLDIIEISNEWNDSQMEQFYKNINNICQDLNKALELESNYMNVYEERVKELGGA